MKYTKDDKRYIKSLMTMLFLILLTIGVNVEETKAADIIEISDPEQLESIGRMPEYPLDGDYVLTSDIDMSGVIHTPIGTVAEPFAGTFDGAGYTIKNLSIQGTDIGKISDLSDSNIVGYGFFGVVKNVDDLDIVRIQNVNIVGAEVKNTKSGNSAAGILAAVIYNGVAINNVAIIDGNIELKANGDKILYGAGHLVGMAWADKGVTLGLKSEFRDIYARGTIGTYNFVDENTVSGVIGCVYNISLGAVYRVVSLGQLSYGSECGYGIATSKKYDANGIMEECTRAYYTLEDGRQDNGIGFGLAKGVLASGKVALSKDGWNQSKGVLPILAGATGIEDITYRVYPNLKRNEDVGCIKEDFYVTTTYNENAVSWTSSSDSVKINGETGLATVTVTDGKAEKVTLTYTCGGKTGNIQLTVGEAKDISFNTQYAKPGQTLKVLYAPDGATYKWEIVDKKTGKSTTWDDTTGEYVVTENDLESFIRVTVNGKTKLSIYISSLPVVYIDSTKGFSGIGKTSYYKGTIMLTGDSGQYAPWDMYVGDMEFKGRGHSSSYYEKVGLKLKLAEKSDMYGASGYENKHWVLVSNVLDGTFMRNSIIDVFASYMEKNSVMDYTDVILIYNGDYKGVYQLYEHVRIDEGRVEVFDYDEYAKDAAKTIAAAMVKNGELAAHFEDAYADELQAQLESDYSYIDNGYVEYEGRTHKLSSYGLESIDATGGYLVVMDRYSQQNKNSQAILHTAYRLPLYMDKPGTDEKKQLTSLKSTSLYNYAVKYNQSFEYALHSDDFFFNNDDIHYKVTSEGTRASGKWTGTVYEETTYTDDLNNGKHYSELFDIDSLVRNFLVCEFSQNYDSMKNSFYYKKDVGELAVVTPFWDYDWSMGNWITTRYTNMPTNWQTTLNGATEMFYQHVSWNRMLIRDPYFLMKVWEQYAVIRPTVIEDIIKEGGFVDTQYEKFKKVEAANELKWKHLGVFMSFEDGMKTLRNFLSKRVTWFDKQFASIDTLIESLGYYHASDYLEVESVVRNDDGSAHIEATVSHSDVSYVAFQVNGSYLVTVQVENGKATIDVPAEKLVNDGNNMVEVKAMDANNQYIINSKYSDPGNYNLIHSNYQMFE